MSSTRRTQFDSSTPEHSPVDPTQTADATWRSPQAMFISTPAMATAPSVKHTGAWTRLREVAEANFGLLLVASSQLFFSSMNVGVKKLNSLDPPVPAVQVSTQSE